MNNVSIKEVDFLSTNNTKGKYNLQILNPPFSSKKEGSGGGRGLWKKFLRKALETADKDTITVCFVPNTTTFIGIKHDVLLDNVSFDNANTKAKVIIIKGEPVKEKYEKIRCKFDVTTRKILPSCLRANNTSFTEVCIAFPVNGTFKSNSDLMPKPYDVSKGASMVVIGKDLHAFSDFVLSHTTFEDWNNYFRSVRSKKGGLLNLSNNDIMTFVNSLGD